MCAHTQSVAYGSIPDTTMTHCIRSNVCSMILNSRIRSGIWCSPAACGGSMPNPSPLSTRRGWQAMAIERIRSRETVLSKRASIGVRRDSTNKKPLGHAPYTDDNWGRIPNECEGPPAASPKGRRSSRKGNQVSSGHDRHTQCHWRRSKYPEVPFGLHDEDGPRCRHVGNELGGAEKAPGISAGRQRL